MRFNNQIVNSSPRTEILMRLRVCWRVDVFVAKALWEGCFSGSDCHLVNGLAERVVERCSVAARLASAPRAFLSVAKLARRLCRGKEGMFCFDPRRLYCALKAVHFLFFRLRYPDRVDNAGPQRSVCAASPREKCSALSSTPLSHLEAGNGAQEHQCLGP